MRSSQNTEEAFFLGSFGNIFSVYNVFHLNSNDIPVIFGHLPGCRGKIILFFRCFLLSPAFGIRCFFFSRFRNSAVQLSHIVNAACKLL